MLLRSHILIIGCLLVRRYHPLLAQSKAAAGFQYVCSVQISSTLNTATKRSAVHHDSLVPGVGWLVALVEHEYIFVSSSWCLAATASQGSLLYYPPPLHFYTTTQGVIISFHKQYFISLFFSSWLHPQ
jgi:hypothetical protein